MGSPVLLAASNEKARQRTRTVRLHDSEKLHRQGRGDDRDQLLGRATRIVPLRDVLVVHVTRLALWDSTCPCAPRRQESHVGIVGVPGQAGLNSTQIASVTGHLTRSMVDHYTHATLRTARDAVARLPKLA